jgi:hypothetical protein
MVPACVYRGRGGGENSKDSRHSHWWVRAQLQTYPGGGGAIMRLPSFNTLPSAKMMSCCMIVASACCWYLRNSNTTKAAAAAAAAAAAFTKRGACAEAACHEAKVVLGGVGSKGGWARWAAAIVQNAPLCLYTDLLRDCCLSLLVVAAGMQSHARRGCLGGGGCSKTPKPAQGKTLCWHSCIRWCVCGVGGGWWWWWWWWGGWVGGWGGGVPLGGCAAV